MLSNLHIFKIDDDFTLKHLFPGTSWIKPNIYRFNRWRCQHVSEKFRLLFSKANSNYCNAKNREIWPQGLDLGGSTASNWRTSAQIKTLRPYFLTLIYQSYQSISFFLFRGIFQPSKLHLFVGNFKNNRIEILPVTGLNNESPTVYVFTIIQPVKKFVIRFRIRWLVLAI